MSGLVSAIVTTHNRKELCMCSIKSILQQTYPQIECIVIDDASTDGTEEYLRDLIHSGKIQYHYINKEESKGGNYARNIGIAKAQGKYIAFLDDDDEWFSTKIEKQVMALEQAEDLGYAYCGVVREYNMDESTRKGEDISNLKYEDGDIARLVLTKIITTTSTIMIRKSILDECGYFDENLKFWQEYELSIRVLQMTRAVCIRENLVLYRVIVGDKNRLSNKISGWEQAVAYISKKHEELINSLTEEEENYRQTYICIDGINRAKAAQSWRFFMKYCWRILKNKGVRNVFMRKLKSKMMQDK